MTLTVFSLDPDLAECGFKYQTVIDEQGQERLDMIPLTSEEFLHPQEGYHLPITTFHDRACIDLKDMLRIRYAQQADVGVYGDLIIRWEDPELGTHCPDVFVAFGVQDPVASRSEFRVATEGTKPAIVIEVVSPRYRKEDREIKVKHYAQAGVPEYVILDWRTQRGQKLDEVLGYRLLAGHYLPISPADDGSITCQSIGLNIGMQSGRVWLADSLTGVRLLTADELNLQVDQERIRADQAQQQADQERIRADQAQQELAQERQKNLTLLTKLQTLSPEQLQALGIDSAEIE